MVDGIGSTGSVRLTPAAPVAATPAVEALRADAPATPTPTPSRAPAAALDNLARSMAASPPVDKDRVAQIKRAIQTGTFPILPATIADRLLALKLDWNGREPA